MAFLTPQLLFQLKEIIRKHHTAFVANIFGQQAIPTAMLEDLKKLGLIKPTASSIDDAYLYGQVMAALEDPKVANMSAAKVKEYVKQNPIPLTRQETSARDNARMTAASYVVGLGNTIEKDTDRLLIEADHEQRAKFKGDIKDALQENIVARKTVAELKSDLGHKTQDWSRNLSRIAITEKHNAFTMGLADGIKKRHGEDAQVAFRPAPDACPTCVKLHLGPDGQPKVFKLSELPPAGANVGKKQAEWEASRGSVHPHCFTGGKVTTARGQVEIADVLPGDMVLTHKGRFREVSRAWRSKHVGQVKMLHTLGRSVTSTLEHLFLTDCDHWVPSQALQVESKLRGYVTKEEVHTPVDLEVTATETFSFDGIVYNLSVDEDESYVINGIVAHNCQCAMIRVPNNWTFDKDGSLVPSGSLQKSVSFTIPANAQRSPWIYTWAKQCGWSTEKPDPSSVVFSVPTHMADQLAKLKADHQIAELIFAENGKAYLGMTRQEAEALLPYGHDTFVANIPGPGEGIVKSVEASEAPALTGSVATVVTPAPKAKPRKRTRAKLSPTSKAE